MKAFLVGLTFLVAVALLAGIGILLMPLIIVLDILLRIAIMVLFVCFCVWLLGKFIIYVWRHFKSYLTT